MVMNRKSIYPSCCKANAFNSPAIDACDGLNGVKDGIISLPLLCNVTAFGIVGRHYICDGTRRSLTRSGAVVQAAWSSSGHRGHPGLAKGYPLTSFSVVTECSANNTCHSPVSPLYGNWISYLVAKNTDFALDQMSEDEFLESLTESKTEYASMLPTIHSHKVTESCLFH